MRVESHGGSILYHLPLIGEGKAVPQHTNGGAGGGGIAPTHSRPRH
jgi:hypothetical protein